MQAIQLFVCDDWFATAIPEGLVAFVDALTPKQSILAELEALACCLPAVTQLMPACLPQLIQQVQSGKAMLPLA